VSILLCIWTHHPILSEGCSPSPWGNSMQLPVYSIEYTNGKAFLRRYTDIASHHPADKQVDLTPCNPIGAKCYAIANAASLATSVYRRSKKEILSWLQKLKQK
jgi:hypothetical protein